MKEPLAPVGWAGGLEWPLWRDVPLSHRWRSLLGERNPPLTSSHARCLFGVEEPCPNLLLPRVTWKLGGMRCHAQRLFWDSACLYVLDGAEVPNTSYIMHVLKQVTWLVPSSGCGGCCRRPSRWTPQAMLVWGEESTPSLLSPRVTWMFGDMQCHAQCCLGGGIPP